MQWRNEYESKATMQEHGWSGWFVEKNDGSKIFLKDKTYKEVARVANEYTKCVRFHYGNVGCNTFILELIDKEKTKQNILD